MFYFCQKPTLSNFQYFKTITTPSTKKGFFITNSIVYFHSFAYYPICLFSTHSTHTRLFLLFHLIFLRDFLYENEKSHFFVSSDILLLRNSEFLLQVQLYTLYNNPTNLSKTLHKSAYHLLIYYKMETCIFCSMIGLYHSCMIHNNQFDKSSMIPRLNGT